MSKPATIVLGAIAALALALVLGTFALRNKQLPPSEEPETLTVEHPAAVPDAALAARTPTLPPDAAAKVAPLPRLPVDKHSKAYPTEAALMAKLHTLEETDPPLTVELAREGNVRYPNSPDAPERQWMVAKALTTMGLFDEARIEAEIAIERYPGTSWTNDLRRHVLSNPPQ
jgi:hypothetical protein